MQILGWIMSVASLVCLVMTLIKIFQDKEKNGIVHGIIGIVTCGIWAFIWGWINSGRYGNKNIMLIWTVAWILGFILNGMAMQDAMSQMGG